MQAIARQKEKATRPFSPSQFNRENHPRRGSRNGLYANGRAARALPSIAGIGPIVNITLPSRERHTRCCIEIDAKRGSGELWCSEDLQRKAIIDLWDILKRHGYNDECTLPNDIPPHEVLSRMIGVINNIANYFRYEIRIYRNEDNDCFYLKAYHEYELEFDCFAFSIEYLPFLKNENAQLHNIIIALLALIQDKSKIAGLDDDERWTEYFSDWYLESEDDDAIENAKEITRLYTTGEIARYRKLLNKKQSVSSLEKRVKKFKPKGKLEINVLSWVKSGIALIKSDYSLFSFFPDDYNELTEMQYESDPDPARKFRILWSDRDAFFEEWSNDLQQAYESNGMIAPLVYVKEIFPLKDDLLPPPLPSWPNDLAKFFMQGLEVSQAYLQHFGLVEDEP